MVVISSMKTQIGNRGLDRTSIGDRKVSVMSTGPAVKLSIVLVGVISMSVTRELSTSGPTTSPSHPKVRFISAIRIRPDHPWVYVGVKA